MSDTTSQDAIVIERTFDAPVDLIWKMWTDPEHFKNWYGPQGFTIPVSQMDVQVGGKRLICMASPDGSMKFWTAGEFTELVPNQRLAYTESPADENGNIVSQSEQGPPMNTIITIELEDLGERTRMTMTHAGLPAEAQGANEGWNQAFAKMAEYIDTIIHQD